MSTDILAFGAHPDDIEFACGGILAKAASQGKMIVMVDLTLGQKGSHGTPELRKKESLAAAALIGAERVFLDFVDCEVVDSYENRLKLVSVIRKYRPKLILAPMWKGVQNHPDHLACGMMARHACRYARFRNILPKIPHHWVEGILHYPPASSDVVDCLIDVTDVVDTWKAMIRCHQTQLKTFDYESWNLRLAARYGVLINRPYAQGLVKGNPIVVDDVMTIARGTQEL